MSSIAKDASGAAENNFMNDLACKSGGQSWIRNRHWEVETMATKKQDQEATRQGNQQQSAPTSAQQGSPQAKQGSPSAQAAGGQSNQIAREGEGSQGNQGTQMTRRSGQAGQTGLSQRGASMPSLFGANPFDLMRMSPFGLMRRFTEEMDKMFEGFGAGRGLQQSGAGFFAPQVEVFEREGQLVVRADLPGMTKDDVRVEVTDDGLLLEGERRCEHQENQGGVYRSERSYGRFHRLVPLPEGVNAENAQASFNNGVLEITMQAPKRQSRGRQIEIQTEGGEGRSQPPQQDQARTKAAGDR
jgi:HSP20 family protein